jgi:hypothetical protein
MIASIRGKDNTFWIKLPAAENWNIHQKLIQKSEVKQARYR